MSKNGEIDVGVIQPSQKTDKTKGSLKHPPGEKAAPSARAS
jgi:hypothetical protein